MRSTKSPSWIERLLGLGAQPSPPHAFALDGERLRYGGFARDAGALAFREFHAETLPDELFQKGPLGGPARDLGALDAALGRLLERLAAPVREATLVLPDAWLRLVFAESGALPPGAREREEVLRWKLRRLVPFRIEELRLDAVEVSPLPGQQEPSRLMLGFAVEALVGQLEDAFSRAGVRLGRITCNSLASLAALPAAGGDLGALLVAEGGGYTLTVAHLGEPLLHRYKGLAASLPASARADFVRRDLLLTRNFLDEHLPGSRLGRVLAAVEADESADWVAWLGDGLGAPAERLDLGHLPALGTAPEIAPRELVPLVGAVLQEVT